MLLHSLACIIKPRQITGRTMDPYRYRSMGQTVFTTGIAELVWPSGKAVGW